MSDRPSIELAEKRHTLLYERALVEGPAAKNDEAFIRDVSDLLVSITRLSDTVDSLDDYRWLADVAIKWQMIFSSVFNIPKSVNIAPPPERLIGPKQANTALTESEIAHWISRNATHFAFSRIVQTGRISTERERTMDWELASVFLASEVLDGKINFASRMSPSSYYRLEHVWVKEVKRLRAYFRWERKGKIFGDDFRDYIEECKTLREGVVDGGMKAALTEFAAVKGYLEGRYLSNGVVDANKPHAHDLIARKAERIARETGSDNPVTNWINAEAYVRMFYEHIIPAVLRIDTEHVVTVLKAFQYSKAAENGYHVINAFETAIAIYFLNKDIIAQLWAESEKEPRPESSVVSVVYGDAWPPQVRIPDTVKRQCRVVNGNIEFKGVMTESQKQALLSAVGIGYRACVERLFTQSRLIHKDTTL